MLVKMEIYHDGEFWCARGRGEDIFTQATSLDDLYNNMKEAIAVHYGDQSEAITVLALSEVKV